MLTQYVISLVAWRVVMEETPKQVEFERKRSVFRDSTRYAVLVLSTVCMTLVMSNTLALNFTIICMGSESGNGTTVYDYSQAEKGWLFSAVAIGSLIGTIPITELFTRYGARKVKTAYGLISALATLLSPWAASQGFYWLFAMRAIQGFALTMTYSACGAITSQWATLERSGIFMALLSCHLQFSPMFTMPVAGAFCVSSLGWTGVYYLQGILTLVFFALFYHFYRDTPRMHKSVSDKELGKLEKGKSGVGQKPKRTPYGAISKDLCIIGAWMSWVGGASAFQIFLQYGPTYLNKVLHYEVAKTGFATAIPYMLAFIMKVVAGPFSDYATCISERARLVVFTIISQGTMALCFVILALIPTEQAFLGWCAYTAAITFSGLNCVGIFKCAQMVSRQYLTFVMSVFSVINSLSVLILPPFVSFMVPTNSPSEWATVFFIICGLVIVTNVFFCFVCKAEPASWTKDTQQNVISVDFTGDGEKVPQKF
uniref:MFS domain-containing protein n=1 Tax=Steinernema glaseri TaxID=37863 RepID=A0A1I7Y3N0_9BILA